MKFWFISILGILFFTSSAHALMLGDFEYIAPNGTPITLNILPDNRIDGKVMNSYSGTYTQNGSEIKIGPVMSTMMMGPIERMEVEAWYFRFLDEVVEGVETMDTLILRSPHEEMIFKKVSDPLKVISELYEKSQ